MKNLTWQNPEQLVVAQELINKVKSKCCGIKVFYDSYEDYVKDWDDWHWDSVTVHPLAKLKSYLDRMANTEVVPRIYLFPYQKYEIKDEDLTSI